MKALSENKMKEKAFESDSENSENSENIEFMEEEKKNEHVTN